MYTSLASLALAFLGTQSIAVFGNQSVVGAPNADCTALPDPTQIANIVAADGAPATPTGGAVTDGTYALAGIRVFNSGAPAGTLLATEAGTVAFSGGNYEAVFQQSGMPAAGENGTFTFDAPSATATVTPSCPAGAMAGTAGYSSDGMTVVFVFTDPTSPVVVEETFAIQ